MKDGFDTYIYTNCRADEGLQNRDGFQFQAISQDADRTAMPIIQRSLLYEPSPQWMRERRPVSDYPSSLAHIWDGSLTTAAGLYLGRESGSGREGNQLTHAIATTDHHAYGLIRPAQLFGAPFWTSTPAPSKQCPALVPGWQPGPFGVQEAQRFVLSEQDGASILADILTELRRPEADRRRLLFIARRPDPVLHWLTAATLLLPQKTALRISFKIFTQNPAYAEHRVLAVHPDWSSSPAGVDNDLGYAVFDLERQRRSLVQTDEDSRRWVDLFLTEDPYDVMDAAEIAAESGLSGSGAMAFALATVIGRPPARNTVRPLIDWLLTTDEERINRYGVGLAGHLRIAAENWSVDELIRLDRAVCARVPEQAAAVRLDLLRTEIQEIGTTNRVRSGDLPSIAPEFWSAESEESASTLLVESMRSADPPAFEPLLRLAQRFRMAPSIGLLEPGLSSFIQFWSEHPEADYQRDHWASGRDVEDRLRTLLEIQIQTQRSNGDEIGDRWWPALLRSGTSLATRLGCLLVAAAMAHLSEEPRISLVGTVMMEARKLPDPIGEAHRAAEVLWRRRAPSFREIQRFTSLLPPRATFAEFEFPLLVEELMRPDGPPDDIFLGAFTLTSRKLWKPPHDAWQILRAEENIRVVRMFLKSHDNDPGHLADLMAAIPEGTLNAHYSDLIKSLLDAELAVNVFAVLDAQPILVFDYSQRLVRRLASEEWKPTQVAVAFILTRGGVPVLGGDEYHDIMGRLAVSINNVLLRSSNHKLERVEAQIAMISSGWTQLWSEAKKKERTGHVVRRFLRWRR